MIPLLAKNALQIKCRFPDAVMTGNYECAYALGILTAAAGYPEIVEYTSIVDLKEKTENMIREFQTEDETLKRLREMLEEYEPSERFDEQMKALYEAGVSDRTL